jgi:hypothetical protein
MYGMAMRTPTSTAMSPGDAVVPVSVAIREARMTNASAPKKRVMSVCARVGWRMARSATLMKIST